MSLVHWAGDCVCVCVTSVSRDLLAAGRVQFKNCVLDISNVTTDDDVQPASVSDVTDDVIDTVQVSHVLIVLTYLLNYLLSMILALL